eukprot:187679_1
MSSFGVQNGMFYTTIYVVISLICITIYIYYKMNTQKHTKPSDHESNHSNAIFNEIMNSLQNHTHSNSTISTNKLISKLSNPQPINRQTTDSSTTITTTRTTNIGNQQQILTTPTPHITSQITDPTITTHITNPTITTLSSSPKTSKTLTYIEPEEIITLETIYTDIIEDSNEKKEIDNTIDKRLLVQTLKPPPTHNNNSRRNTTPYTSNTKQLHIEKSSLQMRRKSLDVSSKISMEIIVENKMKAVNNQTFFDNKHSEHTSLTSYHSITESKITDYYSQTDSQKSSPRYISINQSK